MVTLGSVAAIALWPRKPSPTSNSKLNESKVNEPSEDFDVEKFIKYVNHTKH